MAAIPANVLEKMNSPGTVKALVTVSDDGRPHAIVAGSIISPAPNTMVIGEILMKKSAENMKNNKKVSFLVSAGKEAYSIDCTVKARMDSGPQLDEMNKVLASMNLKAAAVWAFGVDAVYDQSAGPGAGKKMA